MNKIENLKKGEFFKFIATVIRRNGKFYILTKDSFGGSLTNKFLDTDENVYEVKKDLLVSLKVDFDIYFETAIFQDRSNEQLKKIPKKLYQKLTS
jgi:hypothetical protein